MVLLISLSWTNLASYCYFHSPIALELLDLLDNEGESEKQNSEEKIEFTYTKRKSNSEEAKAKNINHLLYHINLRTIHYPEIQTPPPETSGSNFHI